MAEAVNHPAHYGGADNPYEAIKVIEAWGLGFNIGNTVKYLSRAGKKVLAPTLPGIMLSAAEADARERAAYLQDLQKAKWYLDREIANLSKSSDQPDLG